MDEHEIFLLCALDLCEETGAQEHLVRAGHRYIKHCNVYNFIYLSKIVLQLALNTIIIWCTIYRTIVHGCIV